MIKFVHIDIQTLNYDLNQLKSAISEKTRVILMVNLLGNSNEFDSIKSMINNNDIIVLAAFGAGFYWGSVIIKW